MQCQFVFKYHNRVPFNGSYFILALIKYTIVVVYCGLLVPNFQFSLFVVSFKLMRTVMLLRRPVFNSGNSIYAFVNKIAVLFSYPVSDIDEVN